MTTVQSVSVIAGIGHDRRGPREGVADRRQTDRRHAADAVRARRRIAIRRSTTSRRTSGEQRDVVVHRPIVGLHRLGRGARFTAVRHGVEHTRARTQATGSVVARPAPLPRRSERRVRRRCTSSRCSPTTSCSSASPTCCVPFATSYRTTAVAWGVLAFWLLVAVEVSSLVMHRLPRRTWYGIHLTSYVIAVAATLHALYTGHRHLQPGVPLGRSARARSRRVLHHLSRARPGRVTGEELDQGANARRYAAHLQAQGPQPPDWL